MTTKGLQQDQKYEWVGTFWFADNDTADPEKFVGKVTYSPENGIRLSLFGDFNLKDFNNRPSSISRKLMHGIAQKDGSSTAVTLGNIFLSIGYTIGGFHTKS